MLAKNVLEGKTKGYKNHPQLIRFKKCSAPLNAVNYYLSQIFDESLKRNYNFNRDKIDWNFGKSVIKVTIGQIDYERTHLLSKLKVRDQSKYTEFKAVKVVKPHPLFQIIKGEVEDWEIL